VKEHFHADFDSPIPFCDYCYDSGAIILTDAEKETILVELYESIEREELLLALKIERGKLKVSGKE
jgi:hypothetical protein